MSDIDRFSTGHWENLLESIDLEIAQTAIVCHVKLLEPGVAEALLARDPLVWDTAHATALEKLRGLLVMHFTTTRTISECCGADEAREIADRVRAHLRGRVGKQLGEPAA